MTMVALPEGIRLLGVPSWVGFDISNPALGNVTLDSAGEKLGILLQIPKTGTLGRVQFRIAAVTSAQDLKVSFQDEDVATGDPDGAVDQFRVVTGIAANTGFRTGLITSDGTDGGTKRSVTRGKHIFVVFEFNSATGNLVLSAAMQSLGSAQGNIYRSNFVAAWTKTAISIASLALEYDDGAVYPIPGVIPFAGGSGTTNAALLVTAFNNASTPDERGNRLVLPWDARCIGLWGYVEYDFAAKMALYEGSTLKEEITLPATPVRGGASEGQICLFFPANTYTLTKNTVYRTTIIPTTASSISCTRFTAFNSAALGGYCGTSFYSTSRTDGGVFADLDVEVVCCGPIIDAIDVSGGMGTVVGTGTVIRGIV